MPYIFTPAQKADLTNQANNAGIVAFPWAAVHHFVQNIHGVTVHIYRDVNETAVHYASKIARLTKAIQKLQQTGIMFTNADVQQFKVACYTGLSRGVVYLSPGVALPTVALMLGDRLHKHVTTQVAGAVAGGSALGTVRIIADRVYDYYRPTWKRHKKLCELAQIYHEFGHIFHQLTAPTDYFLNAEVAMGNLVLPAVIARNNLRLNTQLQGDNHVSQYAGSGSGNSCLNEYVAEYFSGMMMGVDWAMIDPAVNATNAYLALGGPMPPALPAPITRMGDFQVQQCHCPGNGQGLWGAQATINW